jgi:hypothetical protein
MDNTFRLVLLILGLLCRWIRSGLCHPWCLNYNAEKTFGIDYPGVITLKYRELFVPLRFNVGDLLM